MIRSSSGSEKWSQREYKLWKREKKKGRRRRKDEGRGGKEVESRCDIMSKMVGRGEARFWLSPVVISTSIPFPVS